mmetsp:Transcript_30064/g.44711  ORF Transcript_30064/g.44711 Transcript_30064/m.44711 type:complete len:80 (+) Transcript_30064:81-320(+)
MVSLMAPMLLLGRMLSQTKSFKYLCKGGGDDLECNTYESRSHCTIQNQSLFTKYYRKGNIRWFVGFICKDAMIEYMSGK